MYDNKLLFELEFPIGNGHDVLRLAEFLKSEALKAIENDEIKNIERKNARNKKMTKADKVKDITENIKYNKLTIDEYTAENVEYEKELESLSNEPDIILPLEEYEKAVPVKKVKKVKTVVKCEEPEKVEIKKKLKF